MEPRPRSISEAAAGTAARWQRYKRPLQLPAALPPARPCGRPMDPEWAPAQDLWLQGAEGLVTEVQVEAVRLVLAAEGEQHHAHAAGGALPARAPHAARGRGVKEGPERGWNGTRPPQQHAPPRPSPPAACPITNLLAQRRKGATASAVCVCGGGGRTPAQHPHLLDELQVGAAKCAEVGDRHVCRDGQAAERGCQRLRAGGLQGDAAGAVHRVGACACNIRLHGRRCSPRLPRGRHWRPAWHTSSAALDEEGDWGSWGGTMLAVRLKRCTRPVMCSTRGFPALNWTHSRSLDTSSLNTSAQPSSSSSLCTRSLTFRSLASTTRLYMSTSLILAWFEHRPRAWSAQMPTWSMVSTRLPLVRGA